MSGTITITFLPSGRRVTVPAGTTVLKAARLAGLHINASCGGAGVCGKCRVVVEEGDAGGGKSEKLPAKDLARGYRQACRATARTDLVIRIPAESRMSRGGLAIEVPARNRARMHLFSIDEVKRAGVFVPPVEKLVLELPEPTPADNRADAARLVQGLHDQYDERRLVITLDVLRKLRRALREKDFLVTVTLARPVHETGKSMAVNIQAGNWATRSFGLTIDIGTTTVYGNLVDLTTGRVLARAGDYNGQLSYGEDVISRIIHAERPGGLQRLHGVLLETINRIITAMTEKAGVDREEIASVTLAGNTTMTHFLLELEPDNIRRAPYVPVSTLFPPIRATDLGLDLERSTVALVYPAISSYVGGDIVAGVMGSGMYRAEELTLYVDIGTNAEIVIGNREWLVCAACSAGPAFEGGGITHGMRAAAGAIDDFSIDPDTLEPMILTIGNKPPIGICGSGLLIAIATLFEHNILDQKGRFRRDIDSPRLRQGANGWEYVLAWREDCGVERDITLNEVDIDNFLRAKAAIFAGIKTLVEAVGLSMGDIERIILAGAFGSYIDLDSAFTVGLLPEIDPARIMYVGNGSLLGCWMSEMSNHIRRDVVEVVRRMTSFELSEVPGFKDQYVASLFLPHTDLALFPGIATRCGPVGARQATR